MIPILVRVTGKQKTQLESVSSMTGASQAFIIRRALDEYLERRAKWIEATKDVPGPTSTKV